VRQKSHPTERIEATSEPNRAPKKIHAQEHVKPPAAYTKENETQQRICTCCNGYDATQQQQQTKREKETETSNATVARQHDT